MDRHFLNIFKKLLKCIDNETDALYIYNIYKNKVSIEYKYVMKSMIASLNFSQSYCFDEFIKIINHIKKHKITKKTFNKIIKNTNDYVQIKCLKKVYKQVLNDTIIIEKECPHCGHLNKGTGNTNYIICGYTKKGYDWEGCQRDWCFKCNKKLCKKWDVNELFLESNRIHNTCCYRYAKKHNDNLDLYCVCENKYQYNV